MKKYVVIDTNVLVSALISRNEFSPTVKILKFVASGKIIPVYSVEILQEYNQVLHREKFKLPDEIIIGLLNDIRENGFEVTNICKVHERLPDPKDIVFYAVTLSSRDKNTVLVTGNEKHFPIKPFVLAPAALVQMFGHL